MKWHFEHVKMFKENILYYFRKGCYESMILLQEIERNTECTPELTLAILHLLSITRSYLNLMKSIIEFRLANTDFIKNAMRIAGLILMIETGDFKYLPSWVKQAKEVWLVKIIDFCKPLIDPSLRIANEEMV